MHLENQTVAQFIHEALFHRMRNILYVIETQNFTIYGILTERRLENIYGIVFFL